MTSTVSIYTTPTCHFCHMTKEFFKENDIDYTEHDVAADAQAREELVKKSGQLGVPVTFIGEEMVIGFDEPKLRSLLNI